MVAPFAVETSCVRWKVAPALADCVFYTIGICVNHAEIPAATGHAILRPGGVKPCPRQRVWRLPPDGFVELRRSCWLNRRGCAAEVEFRTAHAATDSPGQDCSRAVGHPMGPGSPVSRS